MSQIMHVFGLYITAPLTYCHYFQMSLLFPFKKELPSLDPLPSLSEILACRFKRRFLTLQLVRVVVPKAEVKEEIKEEEENKDWYAGEHQLYDGSLESIPVSVSRVRRYRRRKFAKDSKGRYLRAWQYKKDHQ